MDTDSELRECVGCKQQFEFVLGRPGRPRTYCTTACEKVEGRRKWLAAYKAKHGISYLTLAKRYERRQKRGKS